MKMTFETPEIEIVRFENVNIDCIIISNPQEGGVDTPTLPGLNP